MLSARNNLNGTVKSVRIGDVMAEVVVSVGGLEIVSLISATSAQKLAVKEGDEVSAVIKATDIMISKPDWACLEP